jgi:adenine C2-methylase RlmN of 23S rRNA A2503 and tRNA A37
MTGKSDIKDISLAGLAQSLKGSGFELYRAKQIYKWLYSKPPVRSFEEMIDLPGDLRAFLKVRFSTSGAQRSTGPLSIFLNSKMPIP